MSPNSRRGALPQTCVVVGAGVGGLALGALLSRVGVRVTVLEAHPTLAGGYAQTIEAGPFRFAAGPRYLWNFGEGQIGRRFLARCGLADRLSFVELDRDGFDHVYVGNDGRISVPNGWPEYETLLVERFPTERAAIGRFFRLARQAFEALEVADELGLVFQSWPETVAKHLLTLRVRPWTALRLFRRARWSLGDAFRACRLSPKLQAVLFAHGMIFALSADELSFHAYVAATLLYHRGCQYPREDMAGLVGGLCDVIVGAGGSVVCGARVVRARGTRRRGVDAVVTQQGDEHAADLFVCNIDPRIFFEQFDLSDAVASRLAPRYRRSRSLTSLFAGIDDAAILRPLLGRWNVWHSRDEFVQDNPYEPDPLAPPSQLYLSSPTLVKGPCGDAPPGGATLTAFVPASYSRFRGLVGASLHSDSDVRREHQDSILDAIEMRFLPGLRRHIAECRVRTPLDNELILGAPDGNVYGRAMTPAQSYQRLRWKRPLPNLYLVGSAIGFPGIAAVIANACAAFLDLTGERV